MISLLYFITANAAFLLLTPIAVFSLIWSQHRSANKVLEQSISNKKDLDAKLEVIRVDVNSNLTAALQEIEDLKARLGITEENPEGTSKVTLLKPFDT